MVERVTVPRWGLVTLGLTFLCLLASLLPVFRKSVLVANSYRIILPMLVGPTIGLIILSPFALHVYFKHEFPLLAFPLLSAKALVLYIFARAILDQKSTVRVVISTVCIVTIVFDAALVHWNATGHSEYPNFEWVKFWTTHPSDEVALTTFNLWGYTPVYFKTENLLKGDEPTQPYWIYQPADTLTDFDRPIPNCRWTGWLRELQGKKFPTTPGRNCVYDQPLSLTVKPQAPLTLDEVAARIKTYSVIDRNDIGIGYLIMKKNGTGP
jgi:hypothetical protein